MSVDKAGEMRIKHGANQLDLLVIRKVGVSTITRHLQTKYRLCFVVIAAVVIAFLGMPSQFVFAQPPSTIKQATKPDVALERRFQAFGVNDKTHSREEIFSRRAEALRKSDSVKDASADITAGHIGFMTLRQLPRGGGRRHAPGVFCGGNPSENSTIISKYISVTIDFTDSLRKNELNTMNLYIKYASSYNIYILSTSKIRNKNCREKRSR